MLRRGKSVDKAVLASRLQQQHQPPITDVPAAPPSYEGQARGIRNIASKSTEHLPDSSNSNLQKMEQTPTPPPSISSQAPSRTSVRSSAGGIAAQGLPTPPASDRGTPHSWLQPNSFVASSSARPSTPASLDAVSSSSEHGWGNRKAPSGSFRSSVRNSLSANTTDSRPSSPAQQNLALLSIPDPGKTSNDAESDEIETPRQYGKTWLDDTSTFNSIRSSMSLDGVPLSAFESIEIGHLTREEKEARINETFILGRKGLKGTGIATGDSTLLGSGPDAGLLEQQREGTQTPKAAQMRPYTPSARINNLGQIMTKETAPSLLPSTLPEPQSFTPPTPTPSNSWRSSSVRLRRTSINSLSAAASVRDDQIKRKPSPSPATLPPRAMTQPFQQQQQQQQQQQIQPLSSEAYQPPVPQQKMPPTSTALVPAGSTASPNNSRSPLSAAPANPQHRGVFSDVLVSVVDLPPPARTYPTAEEEKKMLAKQETQVNDDDWEDESVAGEEQPPPPYVARMSMIAQTVDEKGFSRRPTSIIRVPRAEMVEGRRGSTDNANEQTDSVQRSELAGEGYYRLTSRSPSVQQPVVSPGELDKSFVSASENTSRKESQAAGETDKAVATDKDLNAMTAEQRHKNAQYVIRRRTTVQRRKSQLLSNSTRSLPQRKSTVSKNANRLSMAHLAPEVDSQDPLAIQRRQFFDCEKSDLRSLYLTHLEQERQLSHQLTLMFKAEKNVWEKEREEYEQKIQKLEEKVKKILEKGKESVGNDYHRLLHQMHQQQMHPQNYPGQYSNLGQQGLLGSSRGGGDHYHRNLGYLPSVSSVTPIDNHNAPWELGHSALSRNRSDPSPGQSMYTHTHASHSQQSLKTYHSPSEYNTWPPTTSSSSLYSATTQASSTLSSYPPLSRDQELIASILAQQELYFNPNSTVLSDSDGGLGTIREGSTFGSGAHAPIKEERTMYARMLQEASIGIGCPSSELI